MTVNRRYQNKYFYARTEIKKYIYKKLENKNCEKTFKI